MSPTHLGHLGVMILRRSARSKT